MTNSQLPNKTKLRFTDSQLNSVAKWRSIRTAPKNMTLFLAKSNEVEGLYSIVYFDTNNYNWCINYEQQYEDLSQFSHWMPIIDPSGNIAWP